MHVHVCTERARKSKIPNISSDISEEPDVIINQQNVRKQPGPSSATCTNDSSNNEDCNCDTFDTDFDDDSNALMVHVFVCEKCTGFFVMEEKELIMGLGVLP